MANSSPNEQLKPGIYRQRFSYESNFTQVKNTWMRDPNLSMKAKGLLVYFLTHEIGYTITLQQIIRETSDGKSAIRAAIAELVEVGYLETIRTSKENGWNAGLAYILQEPAKTPMSENPTLENPTLDNRTAYRENNLKEEENLIKEKVNPQTNFEEEFDNFWILYPKKVEKIDAKKVFIRIRRKTSYGEIMQGLNNLLENPRSNKKFYANPAKWLRNGGWTDEVTNNEITRTPEELKRIEEGYF